MLVRTAEVLRQAECAGVDIDVWIVGDAWFGSAGSCVELKLSLNASITFVIPNDCVVQSIDRNTWEDTSGALGLL